MLLKPIDKIKKTLTSLKSIVKSKLKKKEKVLLTTNQMKTQQTRELKHLKKKKLRQILSSTMLDRLRKFRPNNQLLLKLNQMKSQMHLSKNSHLLSSQMLKKLARNKSQMKRKRLMNE